MVSRTSLLLKWVDVSTFGKQLRICGSLLQWRILDPLLEGGPLLSFHFVQQIGLQEPSLVDSSHVVCRLSQHVGSRRRGSDAMPRIRTLATKKAGPLELKVFQRSVGLQPPTSTRNKCLTSSNKEAISNKCHASSNKFIKSNGLLVAPSCS